MPTEPFSQDTLTQADRTSNEFSPYHGALGQAGVRDISEKHAGDQFLNRSGDKIAISAPAKGFSEIYIGSAWNAKKLPATGFLGRLLGLSTTRKFDLDLGVLYELQDGTRGALQALGEADGAFDSPPYIILSHDERTGLSEGDDEYMRINGAQWPHIKRLLIYSYIYEGALDWAQVEPDIQIKIAGSQTLHVRPRLGHENLAVCAIAMMENIRDGFTLENLTTYFPGQAEMDRAYGFGIQWTDGAKERA